MSTPAPNQTRKVVTRSSNKKAANTNQKIPVVNLEESASPILRGKKRRNSTETVDDEPAYKKMAEDKILEAIQSVNR